MTTRDALLAEVIARPDDDLPRLVFADYLEENGDEGWAEFIRLQCRPGYVPDWAFGQPRERIGEHNYRQTREQELHHQLMPGLRLVGWNNNDVVCYTPDTLWPAVARVDVMFTRGFASQVWCDLANWEEYGPRLVRSHPLDRVELECVVRPVEFEPGVATVNRSRAGPLWPFIITHPRYTSELDGAAVSVVDSTEDLLEVVSDASIQWAKSVTPTA